MERDLVDIPQVRSIQHNTRSTGKHINRSYKLDTRQIFGNSFFPTTIKMEWSNDCVKQTAKLILQQCNPTVYQWRKTTPHSHWHDVSIGHVAS